MGYAITESADEANLPMCKEILEYLCAAYPEHPWHVRIDGGILIIKNLAISPTAAMVCKYSSIAHDAGARRHEVVMKAGEFLEAAHLYIGKHRGENSTQLEGLPKCHKAKLNTPVPSCIITTH